MATDFPVVYKAEFLKAIEAVDLEKVAEAIRIFTDARAEGRQIFVCGNGAAPPPRRISPWKWSKAPATTGPRAFASWR